MAYENQFEQQLLMKRSIYIVLAFLCGALSMFAMLILLYKLHYIRGIFPAPYGAITMQGGVGNYRIADLGVVNDNLRDQFTNERVFAYPTYGGLCIIAFNKNQQQMEYARFQEIVDLVSKQLEEMQDHANHDK